MEKVETLKLMDIENVEPKSVDSITEVVVGCEDKEEQIGETAQVEAKKKNKKKKKKDNTTKAADEDPAPAEPEKETNVVNEVSGNTSDEKVCTFCKKTGPTKRCSKRHPKCLPKMFCNDTCESLAHEDKKAALVKKEASKVAAAKKKGMKNKDWKNKDSGQFWWHDQ